MTILESLLQDAVKRACLEPTLLDALTYICIWESERIVDQAMNRHGSGADGAGWDTCFKKCLSEVMKAYTK